MKNKSIFAYNLGIRVFGAFATLGGVVQTIQIFRTPELDIKAILLSFPAWVIYVLVLITIILVLLRNRYKSMSQEIESLNLKLNEQNAQVVSLQEMMKIPSFKNRFFLTTEYLYNSLAEYIRNNIMINSIEISNTIEKKGSGNKRNSIVQLWIQGILTKRMSNFHLLVAGDTIVNFDDINIKVFENKGGRRFDLPARIADNGQDSLLKQVVVSYDKVKEIGESLDLVISWCWPNMLNIKECDYITLPNYLSQDVKHVKISLTNKENVQFKAAGIYKYKVGMSSPELILDIDVSRGSNVISYEEDNPLTNACYILYYEMK